MYVACTSMAGDFIISLKPCEKTSTREYIVNSVLIVRVYFLVLRDYSCKYFPSRRRNDYHAYLSLLLRKKQSNRERNKNTLHDNK